MKWLMELYKWHPALVSLVGYYIVSSGISSLPSPTVTSSMFYLWFFKFSNTLAANLARAYSTQIEASPNFADAVKIACGPAPLTIPKV
jgi:hypothetical protein